MTRKSIPLILLFPLMLLCPAFVFAEELLSGAVISSRSVTTWREAVADGRLDTYFATDFTPFTYKLTMLQAASVETPQQQAVVSGVFSASGQRLPSLRPGLNIVRMSDGTTRKVHCK